MASNTPKNITLIGSGTIGLSFAALHLAHSTVTAPTTITIHDPRPDLREYMISTLPEYLPQSLIDTLSSSSESANPSSASIVAQLLDTAQLRIAPSLADAVRSADIVQEQGPEDLSFKAALWPEVEAHAPATALLWSSTSGIPASQQARQMRDPARLVAVHPYNPPHVMPLLEVVPSAATAADVVRRTVRYWEALGRRPVVLRKECAGFVANRLAFALLRESVHLVAAGVVGVEDLDDVVTSSMGPRWSVNGPLKSYHQGGSRAGLEGFLGNIGGTVQACWDDAGKERIGEAWEKDVVEETTRAYGLVAEDALRERDRITTRVLETVKDERSRHQESKRAS